MLRIVPSAQLAFTKPYYEEMKMVKFYGRKEVTAG